MKKNVGGKCQKDKQKVQIVKILMKKIFLKILTSNEQ